MSAPPTYGQIRAAILRLIKGTELASDIDVNAVTAEIIVRHGRVLPHQIHQGTLWEIIRRHDVTQQ